MKGRTVREFPCPADLWSLVEAWAAQANFALRREEDGRRLYRKGHGLVMAPAFVEIRREGNMAVVEAWVKADMYLILSLLTGSPAEAALEAGGLTAAFPRRRAREAVNRLLARLGQEPIT